MRSIILRTNMKQNSCSIEKVKNKLYAYSISVFKMVFMPLWKLSAKIGGFLLILTISSMMIACLSGFINWISHCGDTHEWSNLRFNLDKPYVANDIILNCQSATTGHIAIWESEQSS